MANLPSSPSIEMIALHKHWCVADAVRVVIDSSVLAEDQQELAIKRFGSEFAVLGERSSAIARLSVWYALLQVVVEGYQALEPKFGPIDELLLQEAYTRGLRRFRNATFHFQEDPLSEKVLEFLELPESEKWIHELNKQFGQFFLAKLPILEQIEQIRKDGISPELSKMTRCLPWAPKSRRD